MRWQRDLTEVPKIFVDGQWVPEPINKIWVNRCWTCKHTSNRIFGSVTCAVTGQKRIPCAECDVP